MERNKYPKMDRKNRAKQFMPFDALKGFREALAEKEQVIVPKRELSEEQKAELNEKLQQIDRREIVTVEYFRNGAYLKINGMVSKIDYGNRVVTIVETEIPFEDLIDLKI